MEQQAENVTVAVYGWYSLGTNIGTALFNIYINGFDSGATCNLHSFTEDIQLGGAVIVLDVRAVRGTLTCWTNGLAKPV